ncbi:hypothetical protein J6590_026551 [Homalodisca vitripennis]|nr:hypothetical protein J6590_026551 [Homalodisca vitripennis]
MAGHPRSFFAFPCSLSVSRAPLRSNGSTFFVKLAWYGRAEAGCGSDGSRAWLWLAKRFPGLGACNVEFCVLVIPCFIVLYLCGVLLGFFFLPQGSRSWVLLLSLVSWLPFELRLLKFSKLDFVCLEVDMAVSLVPEYLRKPELVFEVVSRGQQAREDVKGLRAQLRACLNLERTWQESFCLEDELASCKTRMEELEDDIDSGSLPLTGSAKARLGSQIIHWCARVQLLNRAPGLTADIALESLGEVRSVRERGASFQEPPTLSISDSRIAELGGAAGPQGVAPGCRDLELVSSAISAAIGGSKSSVHPVFMDHVGCGTVVDGHDVSGLFSSAFAKLSHPLSPILKSMPKADGFELNHLLAFLQEAFKIQEFPGMTDLVLMEILAPFCLRPLSDRLLDCLKRRAPFDEFHAQVIEYFIPGRVMERLRVERIYRPQAPGETLSQFVGEIRGVAQILRLDLSERQLVDIILEGINLEDRCRLVFCTRPTSWADLDRLCIASRGVQDADFLRERLMGHLLSEPPGKVRVSAGSGQGVQLPRGQPPTCFGCNQRGHLSRDCPRARGSFGSS